MTSSQPPKVNLSSSTPSVSPVQEALGVPVEPPFTPSSTETLINPTEDYEDEQGNTNEGGSTINFSNVTVEQKYPLKNPKYLEGCNEGVINLLVALFNKYHIDLTDTEGTSAIKQIIRSVKGAWDFYQLMVDNQVQCVVQGFRRNTLTTPSNKSGSGLSGRQAIGKMGNVRSVTSGSGGQARTETTGRWQAINTRGSVIGRIVATSIGVNGYYNNSVVIPTDLFNEVQLAINELNKEDWTLEDIKNEEYKKVIKEIHTFTNDFFSVRFPNPLHCMTSSYFLSKGNDEWLKHPNRKDINAGSYYMFCSNTDTTAALDTTGRKTGLQTIGGLPVGGNNAFILTAESPLFMSFWKKDVEGHELFMLANDGTYNRSITLPQGGFLFGDAGAPNPVIQNLVDILTGKVNETDQTDKYNGNQLLGAITLKMMAKAGFPVSEYVEMELVEAIIQDCKLGDIISPYDVLTVDKYHEDIIKVSKTVGSAEIGLWAAWLVNMIVGVIGSNKAGAARAIAENELTNQTVGEVNEEEQESIYATPTSTTTPSNAVIDVSSTALPTEPS